MNPVKIVQAFDIPKGKVSFEQFGKGHIHSTFRIDHENGSSFILQKLNTYVFKNPAQLMENLVRVCNHMKMRSKELNLDWEILHFFPTRNGNLYLEDEEGECWRLFNYIPHSDILYSSGNIYRNAGEAYGNFIHILDDFPEPPLFETIPHFHDLEYRMHQHDEARKEGDPERISVVTKELDLIHEFRDENMQLSGWISKGKIPKRVTHNDAKVTNILFNSRMEVVSIIDLDTVMNLTIHSDFGDAMRSFATSAEEDEKDESLVHFRMDIFKEFSHGFLGPLKEDITDSEAETLAMAPSYFAYMQAVRFLNDYLLNDTYYHTEYEEHNLVRTKNQLALYKSMKMNEKQMKNIIDAILSS